MKAKHVSGLLAVLFLLALPTLLNAENGAYTGSGGTFTTGTAAGQSITATSVPLSGTTASVSLSCPITSFGAGTYQWNWQCAGGTISIASTDNSVVMNGKFISGTMTFSGSGGGRGGGVNYWYQFSGSYTSSVQLSGTRQGALGSVSFTVHTTALLGSGSAAVTSLDLGWNSRYSPVVVANSGSLLFADNLTGLNLATYGTWGSGTGQFENISGLAHDASGRIYISDSSLDRLVRIDNMTGANWLPMGSSGSGALQFSGPAGVTIDSSGKIWVADAGNNRIVRFDDMSGTNWTVFGAAGSGANQFSAPAAIAFDSLGRIYVADSGNGRLVRFDDLTGKNWTTLSSIPIGVYAYSLAYINGVAILPDGKIIASIAGGYLYRVDDMTGANGEAGNWGTSIGGISADPAGTLFVASSIAPGLAQSLDAIGTGYFSGAMGQFSLQATAVLAMATSALPPPVPIISTTAIAFNKQNVGEPTLARHVVLTNIGRGLLPISSTAADADFPVTDSCPASLAGGASCTVAVQFDPTSTGPKSSTLTLTTVTSVHAVLETALTGTGTAPNGVLLPGALAFNPQQTTTTSGAQLAILTNTGSGPLNIGSITASGDFAVTHNCPAAVAPGNGCTLQITFAPTATGPLSGSINIADDNVPGGTTQQVQLTGTGAAAAPALTLTPEGLFFPTEQVGVTSAAQTLTLKNGSASAVALSAPVFPAGFTGSSTCGTSLAATKSCSIQVKFAPTAPGAVVASVSIPVTGQAALSVAVEGTGVASAPPVLVASPSPLAFGVYVVGDNPSMNLTVTNPKGYPAGIRSMALSSSSVFSVTKNGCPAILAGGASCTVQFMFTPTQVNSYSATWTLTETSGATSPIAVTGSGGTDSGGNN